MWAILFYKQYVSDMIHSIRKNTSSVLYNIYNIQVVISFGVGSYTYVRRVECSFIAWKRVFVGGGGGRKLMAEPMNLLISSVVRER